jgi:hypothetical protein
LSAELRRFVVIAEAGDHTSSSGIHEGEVFIPAKVRDTFTDRSDAEDCAVQIYRERGIRVFVARLVSVVEQPVPNIRRAR